MGGINGGQGRHVENASHSRGLREDVRGLGGTQKNRTDRDAACRSENSIRWIRDNRRIRT
jgi:hypothetical protein